MSGQYFCVELLLGLGLNASGTTNGQYHNNYAPLHATVSRHRPFTPDRAKIVKLLVVNGASLENKCNQGNTTLHLACDLQLSYSGRVCLEQLR
jgi:hypothetical protein